MTYTYSIYRQRKGTKVLILWDGPGAWSLRFARRLLNRREANHPQHKFFIVRDNPLS